MTALSSLFPSSTLSPFLARNAAKLAQLFRSPDWFMELVPLLFEAEVSELCGIRWKHTPTKCQRWGTNPGSVRWNGAKVPVDVPRVRNTETNQEVPLETYNCCTSPNPAMNRNWHAVCYLDSLNASMDK